MLELTGVSYRYAGYATEVLHDIDLRLADGEIVGLVGPNEAGKSTLCLVASGLAPASVGVANPKKIVPRTMKMRRIEGTIPRMHRHASAQPRSVRASGGSGGTSPGRKMPRMKTQRQNSSS